MMVKVMFLVTLLLVFLVGGCAKPYVKAQRAYWSGDPEQAVEILTPDYDSAIQKNSNDRNLFLWDMGVYYFTMSDFTNARDCFSKSVLEYERIAGGTETAMSTLKSASSMTYAGDPVEISVAYLFLGLCYYYEQDYQNAMIAFRRSIEEDQSNEAGRAGDMGITNFVLGECLSRFERWDDAVVAFRRAVEHYPDFAPAWAGLYYALRSQGKIGELASILKTLAGHTSEEYARTVEEGEGSGIVLILYCDKASAVGSDFLTGAFRNRKDQRRDVTAWDVEVASTGGSYALFLADNMHSHFKTQGGAGDEAKKQTTRLVTGTVMKQIPCVGLFAPKTDADIRYWVTLPQTFSIGYLPLSAGTYDLSVSAYDGKHRPLSSFSKSWRDLEVGTQGRTMVLASGYYSEPID